nr:hypothetical protein GCM10017611_12910 [Rhodococcus wratislaviensis]
MSFGLTVLLFESGYEGEVCGLVDDDERTTDPVGKRSAGRSQQHARESTATTATHDEQLRGFCVLAQIVCRAVRDDHRSNLHVRVILYMPCQALGECGGFTRANGVPCEIATAADFVQVNV